MKVIILLANLFILVLASFHEPRPMQNFGSLRPSSGNRPPIMSRPPPSRPMSSNSNPFSRPPPPPPQRQVQATPQAPSKPLPVGPPKQSLPESHTCQKPPSVIRQGGKHYWFSWMGSDPSNAQQSWKDATEICQRFCMNLANIESKEEDEFMASIVRKYKVYGVWLGGQLCQEESCQTEGKKVSWIWQPNRKPINEVSYSNWSNSGAKGLKQPDDFTTDEGCLAILNNWYGDAVVWHDIECQDKFPFVCEK